MSFRLTLKVDARQLESLLPDWRGAVQPFAHTAGEALKEHVIEALREGPPQTRSGRLAKSFHYRTVARGGMTGPPTSANIVLTSDAPQADILNRGGTIVAKRAKYLPIPIGSGAMRGGKGRFVAKAGLSARDIPGLVLRKSKAGNLLLGQLPGWAKPKRGGGRGRPTGQIPPVPPGFKVAFLLKREVKIPAFRYIDRATERVMGKLVDTLAAMTERGLTPGAAA